MKTTFILGDQGSGKSARAKSITKNTETLTFTSDFMHEALCGGLIPNPEAESIIIEESNGVVEAEIIMELLSDYPVDNLIFVSNSIQKEELKKVSNIEIIQL